MVERRHSVVVGMGEGFKPAEMLQVRKIFAQSGQQHSLNMFIGDGDGVSGGKNKGDGHCVFFDVIILKPVIGKQGEVVSPVIFEGKETAPVYIREFSFRPGEGVSGPACQAARGLFSHEFRSVIEAFAGYGKFFPGFP